MLPKIETLTIDFYNDYQNKEASNSLDEMVNNRLQQGWEISGERKLIIFPKQYTYTQQLILKM